MNSIASSSATFLIEIEINKKLQLLKASQNILEIFCGIRIQMLRTILRRDGPADRRTVSCIESNSNQKSHGIHMCNSMFPQNLFPSILYISDGVHEYSRSLCARILAKNRQLAAANISIPTS